MPFDITDQVCNAHVTSDLMRPKNPPSAFGLTFFKEGPQVYLECALQTLTEFYEVVRVNA